MGHLILINGEIIMNILTRLKWNLSLLFNLSDNACGLFINSLHVTVNFYNITHISCDNDNFLPNNTTYNIILHSSSAITKHFKHIKLVEHNVTFLI